jgi:ribosomal protein S27AE
MPYKDLKLPNTRLYKECPECGSPAFGQMDRFCSRCGSELKEHDKWLAGIADYAASLLIEYLESRAGTAKEPELYEIPDRATEEIRANGNILFNQAATRHVLAECWNEVEIALDDWRETNGCDFPVKNIEWLHVFAVTQHTEILWRKIAGSFDNDFLDEGTIEEALELLRQR